MINKIIDDLTPYRDDECKCQVKMAVIIDGGEIVQTRILGEKPCHIRTMATYWGGKYLQEIDDKLYYVDGDRKTPLSEWHKVEKDDGIWIIHEECDQYIEGISAYYKDLEEITKEDGIYIVVAQNDCWMNYTLDGNEGDGDCNFEILKKKLICRKDDVI